MEWHWSRKYNIKDAISVIQVASEDKIVLFHIALFTGKTVTQLLVPSLRKLIEDSGILKCGVAINNADGNRLRRYMHLDPKGMFELSHLHHLVKWTREDRSRVTKRLVKLTDLVQEHFGRPLFKGDVRLVPRTRSRKYSFNNENALGCIFALQTNAFTFVRQLIKLSLINF